MRVQAGTTEPMGVEILVEDGTQQASGERELPHTDQTELDLKLAIRGVWGLTWEMHMGRMFRSVALKEAKHHASRTAAMAAMQWRAWANRIWCREGVAWRTIWTERGGWHGGPQRATPIRCVLGGGRRTTRR